MSGGYHKYTYDGPVMLFNKYVGDWKGETIAKSKAAAVRNLVHQCKTACKKIPSVGGLSLQEDRIKMVE